MEEGAECKEDEVGKRCANGPASDTTGRLSWSWVKSRRVPSREKESLVEHPMESTQGAEVNVGKREKLRCRMFVETSCRSSRDGLGA